MENENYVTVIGRLRWAPQIFHFKDKSGSVTRFTVVVPNPERPYDRGSHIEVKVWDEQLQPMAQELTEASKVHVEGRLRQESWKDDSGNWVNKLVVEADRLTDLSTAETAPVSEAA